MAAPDPIQSALMQQIVKSNPAAGIVPPKHKHLDRFPFLFLIDVSGSTGGDNPDIAHINTALQTCVNNIRQPPPSSPLATQRNAIDLSIIVYSDTPLTIMDWSIADHIPETLPTLVPQNRTATGAALKYSLEQLQERLRYYRNPANNLSSGVPHIFHFTDGAPTDMYPGSPLWAELQGQLANLTSKPQGEQLVTLLHFLTPKGHLAKRVETPDGKRYSGKEMLSLFTGPDSVIDMNESIGSFENLVQFLTLVMTSVTKHFSTQQAVQDAKASMADDEDNDE